jgi:hypothetical protein
MDTFDSRLAFNTPLLQHMGADLRASTLAACKKPDLEALEALGPVLDSLIQLGTSEGLGADVMGKKIAAAIEGGKGGT